MAQPYPAPPGAPVQPAALEGSWRVTAVNGRATPPQAGNYFMQFQNGQVSAKFGCNGMGGTYRVDRGMLVVSNLAQTLMGCPEPASSFESQGGAVLGQPMQMRWDGPARLVLSSAPGTIALAR